MGRQITEILEKLIINRKTKENQVKPRKQLEEQRKTRNAYKTTRNTLGPTKQLENLGKTKKIHKNIGGQALHI